MRVKLTGEDIHCFTGGDIHFTNIHSLEEAEALKKQILDNQEYYEKFHEFQSLEYLRKEFESVSISKVKFKELKEKAEKYEGEKELNNGLDYCCEKLESQVKELKDKAEKWDNLFDTNAVMQWNPSTTQKFKITMEKNKQLESQVKELKEDRQRLVNDFQKSIQKALQANHELKQENKSNKEIVDKLRFWIDESCPIGLEKELKEILGSKCNTYSHGINCKCENLGVKKLGSEG